MNILFQSDPPNQFNLKEDTTFMFMKEGSRRKLNLFWTHPKNVFASIENGSTKILGKVSNLKISKNKPVIKNEFIKPLDFFDAIFIRQDPPFDMNYISNTYLYSHIAKETLVINNPNTLRDFPEKHIMMQFPSLTPPTIFSQNFSEIKKFVKKYKKVIMKPSYGNGGKGIIYLENGSKNLNSLFEIYQQAFPQEPIIVQKFLPQYKKGDKRVILIGGEPVGSINRIPNSNDVRSNFHAGGKPMKSHLSKQEIKICLKIKDFLINNHIHFAGIDIIGGLLTEINITSPTGIQEINRFDEVKIEKLFFDYLQNLLK